LDNTRRFSVVMIGLVGGIMSIAGYMDDKWMYFKPHPLFFALFGLGCVTIGALLGLRFRRPVSPVHPEIRVLHNNHEMAQAVKELINRNPEGIAKVTVIQYSGVNSVSTVRDILERTNATVEVYFVDPAQAATINEHQKKRTTATRDEFRRDVLGVKPSAKLQQFSYNTPGAIRAVLIEGQALFVGAYLYQVVGTLGPAVLDICGGEMPLFEVPYGHAEFLRLAKLIEDMVKNWKEEKTSKGQFTAIKYEPRPRERGDA
jgi:hypothetical protein